MAKCFTCGAKGLFLKVDPSGNCSKCADALSIKKQEETRIKNSTSSRRSLFQVTFPGETLRYKYTDVKLDSPVIYPESFVRCGSVCGLFRMAPESDEIEVNVPHGDENLLIGFLPHSKLANMAGDWFDRSWNCIGQVSEIRDRNIYIDIAFWTPDDER